MPFTHLLTQPPPRVVKLMVTFNFHGYVGLGHYILVWWPQVRHMV